MSSSLATVQNTLRGVKTALANKYGINDIGLFGSVVRNDFTPESDIDILVSFNQPIGIEFVSLADELEELLQHKVDLVSKNGIREKYFEAIKVEIVYV